MPFVPATMSGPHSADFEARFAQLLELASPAAAGWTSNGGKDGVTQWVPADGSVGARSDGHVAYP